MPPPFQKKSATAKRKAAKIKRPLKCRFCTPDGCPRPVYVDYKDMRTLKAMVTRDGHIIPRRKTGNCQKFQRAVRTAIIRARFMGLMPYVIRED